MFKSILMAVLLISSSVSFASIIDVTYSFGWNGDRSHIGYFSGSDDNLDGMLEFSELTSIQLKYTQAEGIQDLFDFGDFDIDTQVWTPNAIAWLNADDVAFFTFDNRDWSCNTSNGCGVTITSLIAEPAQNVSAPSMLGLLGVCLFGMYGARRLRA